MITDRIAAARERLAEALRTGQNTASFRKAIAQLEADAVTAGAQAAQRAAELAATFHIAVEARATALVAECHSHAHQEKQP